MSTSRAGRRRTAPSPPSSSTSCAGANGWRSGTTAAALSLETDRRLRPAARDVGSRQPAARQFQIVSSGRGLDHGRRRMDRQDRHEPFAVHRLTEHVGPQLARELHFAFAVAVALDRGNRQTDLALVGDMVGPGAQKLIGLRTRRQRDERDRPCQKKHEVPPLPHCPPSRSYPVSILYRGTQPEQTESRERPLWFGRRLASPDSGRYRGAVVIETLP